MYVQYHEQPETTLSPSQGLRNGPLYFQILIFSFQKNASFLPQKNGEQVNMKKVRRASNIFNSFNEIFSDCPARLLSSVSNLYSVCEINCKKFQTNPFLNKLYDPFLKVWDMSIVVLSSRLNHLYSRHRNTIDIVRISVLSISLQGQSNEVNNF